MNQNNIFIYHLVIKHPLDRQKVKKLEKIKLIIEAAFLVFLFSFTIGLMISALVTSDTLSVAWLYIAVILSIICFPYNIFFYTKLKKIVKNQSLDETNQIDLAIKNLSNALNIKKIKLFCIVGISMTIVGVSMWIAYSFLRNAEAHQSIMAVLNIATIMSIMLPMPFLFLAYASIQYKVSKKEIKNDISMLIAFFMTESGVSKDKIKDKILDDLLDKEDDKIRNEMKKDKAIKRNWIIGGILCCLPFVIGFVPMMFFVFDGWVFSDENTRNSLFIAGIIFVSMFVVAGLATFVFILFYQKWKENFLQRDLEKYKHHIEINKIRTKHYKIVALILSVTFVVVSILSGGLLLLVVPFLEALTYGILIGFVAIYIAWAVINFTLLGKDIKVELRELAEKIEEENK